MSKNTNFPFLTQTGLNLKAVVPSALAKTFYRPQKDRAWLAMAERINLDAKTLSFGKK